MTNSLAPPFRDDDPSGLMPAERDACAIICYVNKAGRPTHGNVQRTIDALIKMGHRAGEISGEGDGCGVLTDIPRLLWRDTLAAAGHPAEWADLPGFAVGHLLVPKDAAETEPGLQERIVQRCRELGARVLVERPGTVRSEVLAASVRRHEPRFWQLALMLPEPAGASRLLHELQLWIELQTPVHVASLSTQIVAWKLQGAPEQLARYYPALKRRDFLSAVTIGHSRFSTNTLPTVFRAQPFSLLGHNGEINTIARLREEARLLGLPLPSGGSDSQDLNRTLEGLIHRYGVTLFEAMEMVFPPIFSEAQKLPADLQAMYSFFRRLVTASAQGPAAIIARHHDRLVFSVDAMGLRPLWFGETEKEYFASSEVGVVPQEEILADPKPLAPGEKLAIRLATGRRPRVLEHDELRREVLALFRRRTDLAAHAAALAEGAELPPGEAKQSALFGRMRQLTAENLLSALAWKASDLRNLKEMASSGDDPIASLGYDGPLAALAAGRQNLADYFKEQVAVVTNPAIDREREAEHFSTRVFLGPRPRLRG
ncbi:MAG: glutamate synthase, partial [Desulfuromonadales bacterium]|nr:glutamate synthase [Desulfuromonadales bacterium]